MNKQLTVIPKQIKEVIDHSNITDLTEAEKIASRYVPYMEQITELSTELKKLEKGNEGHVSKAKRIRLDLGKVCSSVAAIKKEDKALLLTKTRFIDGLFNTVDGAGRLTQGEAKEIELHFEKIEEERRDKLRTDRELQLEKYDVVSGIGDLADMSEEVWKNFLQGTKLNYENRIAAEKKAEDERLERERLLELHNQRKESILQYWQFVTDKDQDLSTIGEGDWKMYVAELKKEKEEYDKEQEHIRIENERLKKEAEAKRKEVEEKERKARHEFNRKLRIEKEEKARIETELKAKEEAEAKAKADQEAKIQAELSKGDAEKVKDLIIDLQELKTKYTFKSKKNQKIYSDVGLLIDKIIAHIG